MEEKYKLSFIIPMYNAEKYIGNCLDSILNSDLPQDQYEVLVIDDGSEDKGTEIALNYVDKYCNISYLVQENQGQSTARNNGIKQSQGEYIWCVDSDDKLDSKQLQRVFGILNDNENLDILGVQLQRVTEEGGILGKECSQPTVTHNQVLSGRDAIIKGYNPSSICALIVKRELILDNNIFFVKGITHQDVELTYRLMPRANKVLFTDIVPYIYINHPNSTSKSLDPQKKIKYVKDDIYIINSFKALSDYYASSDPLLSKVIFNRSQNVLFSLICSLFKNKKRWKSIGVNSIVLEELKRKKMYPLKGEFDSWKKRIISRLVFNKEEFFL